MAGVLLPDDTSVLEPPEPIPNSAVKRHSADGSVGSPHVRVGRRQDFYPKPRHRRGFFVCVSRSVSGQLADPSLLALR